MSAADDALARANAVLDDMIATVLAELLKHRAEGLDDSAYQGRLIHRFQAAAARLPHGAGAFNMALAMYRLAVQRQQLERLTAENARYAATLRDLEALEGL